MHLAAVGQETSRGCNLSPLRGIDQPSAIVVLLRACSLPAPLGAPTLVKHSLPAPLGAAAGLRS